MIDLRVTLNRIQPTDDELEKRKERKSQYPIVGITRDELADRLEVSVRTIDNWLAGNTNPSRSVVREIERWVKESKEDDIEMWARKRGTPLSLEDIRHVVEEGETP